ncbi:MAG TPA: glycosyltransferase, partial [Candidatus Dormibacteraeota bacterium]|nr:glycosyltransferase [Candidatus Dormibacteraeota bacterium]
HDGRMFAYAPMTLAPFRPYPLFDRPAVQRRTLRATLPRFKSVLERAGFEAIDLLWMSTGSPLLALLDDVAHGLSIYRMSDDTAAFPDTPRTFAAIEREACRRADLVLATARVLEDRARELGARRVLYLPNACEPERFTPGAAPEPIDLRGTPRPRAIYAGAIDAWFDATLLRDVARILPAWTFLVIGPARAETGALRGLANVRLLGPRAYANLPAYLGAADAGLVPFVLNPLTHAIHPLKVYEYCAAGLPVVATPMRETAAMGAPLLQAATAPEFAAALEETRREGTGRRAQRLEFARRNTWDQRYAVLRSEIAALSGRRPAVAAGGRR